MVHLIEKDCNRLLFLHWIGPSCLSLPRSIGLLQDGIYREWNRIYVTHMDEQSNQLLLR